MAKGKAFETEKHGYRTADVEKYMADCNRTHGELKERIADLTRQLSEKETELKAFKQKQDLIVKSIMGAVQKAEQIENLIRQKYTGEMAHLNAFHEVWTAYYKRLLEKYPLDSEIAGLSRFNKRLDAILSGEGAVKEKFEKAREQFESENERLKGQKKKYVGFIPVDGAVVAGSDDGFDLPNFNPEENIRQMLRRQAAEEEQRLVKEKERGTSQGQAVKNKKPPIAATTNSMDLGGSDSGFSFEEALNPTQQLSDILKEIGIELGSDD